MSNKFAAALKKPKSETPPPEGQGGAKSIHARPSRKDAKHIGGYFDPAVSKQLKALAVDEDSSVQALLAEALDLLFQSRRKPTIAQK